MVYCGNKGISNNIKSPTSMIRNLTHQFIDWLFKYSAHISCVAIVLLSVIDISNLNDFKLSFWGLTDVPIGYCIYVISVLFAVIFGICGFSNQNDIARLEKENKEKSDKINDLENALSDSVKEMNELFNSYLTLLVKNLNFQSTERISVYKVYEDKFVLIGRASDNPNLQKTGRANYPIEDGFIGKGWEESEYFIDSLPDPNYRNGDTYFSQANAINKIDRNVLNEITMKSRTYFVYRIKGYDNQPKAVLVAESLKCNAFTKDEIIQKLSGVKQPLVMFIEKNNGVKLQPQNNLGL